MTFHRRTLLLAGAAALAAPALRAQGAYPNRAIRVVVPFPPGSVGDSVPRFIATRLQASLGQPVVLENRPGAGGAIGAEAVATAAPDGYTLLSHSVGLSTLPHIAKLSFDPLKLEPITQTISGSYVLVVRPDFPASNLREFIAHVRKQPGRLNYGSHGSGSGVHLVMELLKSQAGLFIVHVPYRGAAPAMQDLLAGRLDMAFDSTAGAMAMIRAGKLKPLAVGGLKPVPALPGVATIAEQFPGFDTDGWQGLWAPPGTPREIVARLNAEAVKAVNSPEFGKLMSDAGFVATSSTPEQFGALHKSQHEKWGRLIRERGIQPD